MPRVKRKFKDNEIAVCIESFVTSTTGVPIPVAFGDRLLGKHPIVQACSQFFAPDGTASDEIARLRARIYADAEAEVPPPPPPRVLLERRVPDEDAMVNIQNAEREHRESEAVRRRPDEYVPVVPTPKLDRRDALVARKTMSELGPNGEVERIVYAGQWVHRDDPFVLLHGHESFDLPPTER